MKKILLLLAMFCCVSCEHTVNDTGVVVSVRLAESNESHTKYIITIGGNGGFDKWSPTGTMEVLTNRLYQVGDTIMFVKRQGK